MVHEQETCFRSVFDLERCIRKLREALQLVKGSRFSVVRAMSRCFPFPPPGYIKKPRPDDANLLIKEKSKEKKHKKEKDKEKKERKEKRKKEKSEEKRKEKKDKKHKDKDKDKDKDKEKRKTSEKVLETSEHHNGGRPSPIGIQSTVSEPQFLLELEKRFRNDNGATESKMVEKIVSVDHASISLQHKFTERNIALPLEAKEKPKDKSKDQSVVNGETLKVVASGLENGVVSSFMGEDRKQGEGGVPPVQRTTEKPKEHKERKEKKKHKHHDGKGEKHRDREERKQKKLKDKNGEKEKKKEKAMEQIKESSPAKVGNGPSGLFRESNCGNSNLGKRKYPETNGVFHDNDSRSTKLPRLVSSSHPIMQNGNKYDPSRTAQVTVQDHKVNDKVSFTESRQGNGRKLDSGNTVHGITREQKSTAINHTAQDSGLFTQPVRESGRLLESSKVAINLTNLEPVNNHKVNSKLQMVVENRGDLDCRQLSSVEKQEPICPPKMDNKKHVINGLKKKQESKQIEPQKRSPHPGSKYPSPVLTVDNKVSSSQPVVERQGSNPSLIPTVDNKVISSQPVVEKQGSLCPAQVDNKKHVINGLIKTRESKKKKEKVETRERPPHPDLKYLSQILTVPEVEWSEFDDQEWLFSSNDSKTKKSRTDSSSQSEEIKQVWAEAIRVESADVVALPYVIPY